MRIDELTLRDFRNYAGQTVAFDPGCNVIFGQNAEGKTNLLEAIVYLACGKSPRARRDQELIRFEAEEAKLTSRFSKMRNDGGAAALSAGMCLMPGEDAEKAEIEWVNA